MFDDGSRRFELAARPIDELNRGLRKFAEDANGDDLTRKQAEVSVIKFGPVAEVVVPFCEVREFTPPTLVAEGGTPLGAALQIAMSELEQRKQQYRAGGIEYFRPWLIVMSDGTPTDTGTFETAVHQLNDLERRKAVAVFSIAIGKNADVGTLSRLSVDRPAVQLNDVKSFGDFFVWLSRSLASVSQSDTHAETDGQHVAQGTQVTLPPIDGWGRV